MAMKRGFPVVRSEHVPEGEALLVEWGPAWIGTAGELNIRLEKVFKIMAGWR